MKRNKSPRMCKDNVYFAIFWLFKALLMVSEVLFSIAPCTVINIDWCLEEVFSLRNANDSARHLWPEKEF